MSRPHFYRWTIRALTTVIRSHENLLEPPLVVVQTLVKDSGQPAFLGDMAVTTCRDKDPVLLQPELCRFGIFVQTR